MKQVGTWQLEGMLGRGGMGTVYAALDSRTGQRAAVKVLRSELCEVPEFLARFEREARVLARLDHPNLVPLLAVDVSGRSPYFVMKLIEGTSLSDLINRRGRMTAREALPLLTQLAQALEYLHARGFVHRDVKPANCVVTDEGHLTLLDFGLSRPVGETNITRADSDVLLGTPEYMAPEQVLRHNQVDHRADLYSLGAVAYRLLTGSHAFSGDDLFALVRSKLEETPQLASERHAAVSESLARVLARALSTSPAARYDSALEFDRAMVEAFALDRTETSTASTHSQNARPTDPLKPAQSPRPRWPLVAGTVSILALAGALAWLTR